MFNSRNLMKWAFGLCLLLAVRVNADSLTYTQISDGTHRTSLMDISGNTVVWYEEMYYDSSGLGREIFYYDGNSTTRITNDDNYDRNAKLSDGNIVWASSNETNAYMYFWNASYMNPVNIIDGFTSYDNYSQQISGDKVVFEGKKAGDNNQNIYMWDGGTGTVTRLSDDSDSYANPYIEGDKVVWNGGGNIYLWDNSSGTPVITPVTTNGFMNNTAKVSGDYVAWIGREYFSGYADDELFLWDGSSTIMLTENVCDEFAYLFNLDGNKVVWNGWETSSKTDTEIYYYDGVQSSQLTDNDYADYNPYISGDIAVWYDVNKDLFMYDGEQTTELVETVYNDYNIIIDGVNVAWQRNNTQIMLGTLPDTSVPEPATLVLMGLGSLIVYIKRKRF